jgi:hypothetical protein
MRVKSAYDVQANWNAFSHGEVGRIGPLLW